MTSALRAGLLLALGASLLSCERAKNTAKAAIHHTGEAAGQSATVLAEGVADGVNKAIGQQTRLSPALQQRGLALGKVQVGRDDSARVDNRLTLYVIFNQAFRDTVTVKLLDKTGQEYGRQRLPLTGRTGEARNVDVHFDARTDIELGSRVVLE